jgi:hypothetical protein
MTVEKELGLKLQKITPEPELIHWSGYRVLRDGEYLGRIRNAKTPGDPGCFVARNKAETQSCTASRNNCLRWLAAGAPSHGGF